MTAYKDKKHHDEIGKKIQNDKTYFELASKLKNLRKSFEIVILENSYEM